VSGLPELSFTVLWFGLNFPYAKGPCTKLAHHPYIQLVSNRISNMHAMCIHDTVEPDLTRRGVHAWEHVPRSKL